MGAKEMRRRHLGWRMSKVCALAYLVFRPFFPKALHVLRDSWWDSAQTTNAVLTHQVQYFVSATTSLMLDALTHKV